MRRPPDGDRIRLVGRFRLLAYYLVLHRFDSDAALTKSDLDYVVVPWRSTILALRH